MMTVLLISGSREWVDPAPVCQYVQRVVARAIEQGYTIYVGDAPGVDAFVVEACREMSYQNHTVTFALTQQPRNGGCGYTITQELVLNDPNNGIVSFKDYTHRDRYMVELSDIVMCIWNGHSRGTRRVFDYAQMLGKDAHLRTVPQTQRLIG